MPKAPTSIPDIIDLAETIRTQQDPAERLYIAGELVIVILRDRMIWAFTIHRFPDLEYE